MAKQAEEIVRQRRAKMDRDAGRSPEEAREREDERQAEIERKKAEREQAEQERRRRIREFLGESVDREQGLPDVRDVALELSRRHRGDKPARLSALLFEARMAWTLEDAAPLCKQTEGRTVL